MSFDTPRGGAGRDVGRQAACAVPEQFKVISGFQVMNYKVFPHQHSPLLVGGQGWRVFNAWRSSFRRGKVPRGGCNYRASLGLRYAQHDLFSTKLVFIVACLYTNCEYFLWSELRDFAILVSDLAFRNDFICLCYCFDVVYNYYQYLL